MRRRRFVLGSSLLALAAVTALGFASAASAGSPVVPQKIDLSKPTMKGQALGKVEFLRTTAFGAVAPKLGTAEVFAPAQRSVNRPTPKGSPGDAPYAPPAYPTVASTPISSAPSGSILAKTGVTGYEQRAYGGYSLEPPDTEICAGNGYVIQAVNNIIEIYNGTGHELSSPMPVEYFFTDFKNDIFDPKCIWDPDTRHFFVSYAVGDFSGGSFTGVYIAVSQTDNPLGGWNIYFLDTSDPFGNAGCLGDSGYACLGDQPLLGADKWTIQISTNEFPLVGGFNGAQMFFLDKTALAMGLPFPNVVGFDLADTPTPDGACPTDSSGTPCWYSVQPAETSNANYDLHQNGTQFALSALDFYNANDNRIALWAFVNTRSISSSSPSIGGLVAPLSSNAYGMPPFATQKEGPHPLGELLGVPNVRDIQSNDDRMNEVDYNSRTGWLMGGLNTGVCVQNCDHFRAGIAWFGARLQWAGSTLYLTGWKQGYIANRDADTLFPASATVNSGNGVWAYSLTGDNIFPSAAFSTFGNTANPSRIVVSQWGKGPQDGFTEYSDIFFGNYRPRWGDYSGATADGNKLYWATEFIDQTCTVAEYVGTGGYCGGTRGPNLNWANSIAGAISN